MIDTGHMINAETPTAPHPSRLVWLGEQLTAAADELADLFEHERILADLNEKGFAELRRATAAARTAGGDVLLIASAAHHRVRQD